MPDESENGEAVGSGQAPDDPGPRLAILREIEVEPSRNFLRTLRRKIYRRSAISQVASAAWDLPARVFLEVLGMLLDFVSPSITKKGDR